MIKEYDNLESVLGDYQTADNDYLPQDAKPLCSQCLQPCDPLSYYCPYCGSYQPINPLTPYMPFQNIRFNYGGFGIMWRRIWFVKGTPVLLRLFYLFLFIIFLPILVLFLLPLTLLFRKKDD